MSEITKYDKEGKKDYTLLIILAIAAAGGVGFYVYTTMKNNRNTEQETSSDSIDTAIPSDTSTSISSKNFAYKFNILSKSATITAKTDINLGGGFILNAGESETFYWDDIVFLSGKRTDPPIIKSFTVSCPDTIKKEGLMSTSSDITVPQMSTVRLDWDTKYWKTLIIRSNVGKELKITRRRAYKLEQIQSGTAFTLIATDKRGQEVSSTVYVRVPNR